MSPLHYFRFKYFLLFCLVFASTFFASFARVQQPPTFLGRRNLLEKSKLEDDEQDLSILSLNNKKPSVSSKNQTKLIKPSSSLSSSSKKNQTKLLKPTISSHHFSSNKNKTKLITSSSKNNKTKSIKPTSSKNVGAPPTVTKLKFNSASSLDLPLNNKEKSSSTTITKTPLTATKNKVQKQKQKFPSPPTWLYPDANDEDYDFISGFRDLPTKFHKTFVPDLHIISTTSKIYLSSANKEITKTFVKPYVGKNNKYASTITTAISCAFIIVPFLLVSLIFNHIKAYFSLQKLVIFIQIYLAIYFSILCLSSWVTGLEPLRFFYATSQSTYVWLQVLQTLGYVMYLLMLLMYLILVFSTDSGLGQKFLSLTQTFVGFAIGLHYYMTVFHPVVLHQPPKTNWKVYGIYATCFLVICLFANAERRKKAYLEEDGEEGKLN